jgi:hypothetical protein
LQIMEAYVRNVVDRNGTSCGVVEIVTDDRIAPELLAYFSLAADNSIKLESVIRNDANTESDWFDNNMHQALEEITDSMFQQDDDWTAVKGDREAFIDQVLSSGQVRDQLNELLREG